MGRGRRGRNKPWWRDTCRHPRPDRAEHTRCRTGCSTAYCTTCRRPTGGSTHYVGCPCDRRELYPIDMQHKPTMQHLIKGETRG